ncbi:MAG TPA: hypothetical protein VHF25_14530 [Nitriliruptorales bacterium]|nr:hypothetical protein [Nitriliruptorales bacterium]
MRQPERLLVVTTRSKLRGARFFPSMMGATVRVRRQLAATEGIVRWASIVASPTEFWTITAWRNLDAMQRFMRSGAHGEIMWSFSRWLQSFWLMRWRPGPRQMGDWGGLTFASGGSMEDDDVEDPKAAPAEVLDAMAERVPQLYRALGPDGGVSYDTAPSTRRFRRYVEGTGGAVVRIVTSPAQVPQAVRELGEVRQRLRGAGERLLGSAVGVGKRGEAFLLAVWTDPAGAGKLLDSDWARQAAERWGGGYWASEWLPENEFGHWDGRRLRRERRRRASGPAATRPR